MPRFQDQRSRRRWDNAGLSSWHTPRQARYTVCLERLEGLSHCLPRAVTENHLKLMSTDKHLIFILKYVALDWTTSRKRVSSRRYALLPLAITRRSISILFTFFTPYLLKFFLVDFQLPHFLFSSHFIYLYLLLSFIS